MLQSLHIQNYALIESLDIDFYEGFSVITGETGAGKSILLGAIGLLLGQRADLKMIKAGASRCIIEARFDLSQYDFSEYFTIRDFDFDGTECIIRRELTSTGKSRAFINDTPAALSDLKELGEQLIDIHSQHQNLLLNKADFQLRILDAMAQDSEILEAYKAKYRDYCQVQTELATLQAESERDKTEQEYIAYQVQQLEDANLVEDEEDELSQELNTLTHAEDIKSGLYQASEIIENDERGLVEMLQEVQRKLESIATLYSPAQKLAERIDSCQIEMRDIANELVGNMENIEYDPDRLDFVSERISTLNSLKQKFHAEDIRALLSIQQELKQRLSLIENYDERLHELQEHLRQIEKSLDATATKLSSLREKASVTVEKEMCKRLVTLGMPNVQFKVDLSSNNPYSANGCDKVVLLFSANKNIPMQPISQVASGGEISRLMLALKVMVGKTMELPTIIFDEIDTGVSGQMAEKMAQIMQEMGKGVRKQVISITHLPQIAALGKHHYRVYKTDQSTTTTSNITMLHKEERIEELARMLSGSKLTQAAIDNAKALLGVEN